MPTNCIHADAPHDKLRVPDTYVSALMLDRALDAILRRVKAIDRDHDIPYLAGYSRDGRTIYIDRHLPASFAFRGRAVMVDRFLILHEEVEKAMIDHLGLHYQHAHQIATRAEEAAVRAEGIGWRAYDRFMQTFVKEMGDERLTKVPANLDLTPYRDEHDFDLMKRMATSLADPAHPMSRDRRIGAGARSKVAAAAAHGHAHAPGRQARRNVAS
ncbi:MAG: hypothetical protein KGI57_05285 [Hyphomicrobiales bacterium]|nr:hypothetical protein [Hyphomicrobiales bacterium]MDE2017101.1 hypothetical protein [Hyphomicrobiales bacterium]